MLCQRCLRTICPECQTPAPVGVICPECLSDQLKAQSPAQQKAQKAAERRWSRPKAVSVRDSRPIVTYTIIGITGFVFLLQYLVGSAITQSLLFFAPYLYPGLSGTFEPWRLLSVLLVHDPGGIFHVGLNMLALWMIGRSLEPFLGRWRFLSLYLISGLGGSVAVALLGFGTPVVGASGAIYGLFGALIVVGRHIGANITAIIVVLGINLVFTFLPLLLGGSGTVSWQAHIGGLAVGALIGFIFTRTRSPKQRGLQIALLAAVTVGLLLLLLIPPLRF